jgi:glucokinase
MTSAEEVTMDSTRRSTHRQSVSSACFCGAGPIKHNRREATNLPWVVDVQYLVSEVRIPTVRLINDLEANAYGIATLVPTDVMTLNIGTPDTAGNAAVIAAGTSLGEAGLYWDGSAYHPFATEGGHTDFAPRTILEVELLQFFYPSLNG